MIEEKRNKLNLEARLLLAILDMIDGESHKYPDYNSNDKLTEEQFLDQQIELIELARKRLAGEFED